MTSTERRRVLAGIAGAVLFITSSQGRTVETNPVKVTLSVNVAGPRNVVAEVTYANVSRRDLWILKEPPGFYLSLDGREIRYVGPMVKRAPYTLDDYERLTPGQLARRSKRIEDDFAFVAGTHVYELRMAGGYYDPVTEENFEAPLVRAGFTLAR